MRRARVTKHEFVQSNECEDAVTDLDFAKRLSQEVLWVVSHE